MEPIKVYTFDEFIDYLKIPIHIMTTEYDFKETIKLCPENRIQHNFISKLCYLTSKGDLIISVPNTATNTYTILSHNYINRIMVGFILNKLNKFTPCFRRYNSIDFQLDKKNIPFDINIYMEKLSTKYPINNIQRNEKLLYLTFQIIQSLYISQNTGKYTNFNLTKDTCLYRYYKHPNINIYPLNNGQYLYTYFDFDCVISDYNYSRYESENNVYMPKINKGGNAVGFYTFNPYIDLFTFLSSMRHEKIIDSIFKLFLNNPDKKMLNYLKTAPENLASVNEHWEGCKNIKEMIEMIEKTLINYHNSKPGIDILEQLKKSKLLVVDKYYNFENSKLFEKLDKKEIDTTFYKYYYNPGNIKGVFNGISIQYIKPTISRDTVKRTKNILQEYNIRDHYVDFNHIKTNLNTDQQYIHVATIVPQDGYSFNLDCCRIDLLDYFQNPLIKSGIAINASFFNMMNYNPIGPFKNSKLNLIDNENLIPKDYENEYGLIGITKNGNIDIKHPLESTTYSLYSQLITSGPLLVYNSKIVLTDNIIREDKKYQCRNPKNNEISTEIIFTDGITNCSRIQPGKLSHSSNPNPRSALVITEKNEILFIYVEGRAERGAGMDLSQLAELCLKLNAKKAINLDGGRSSQMVWRRPDDDKINISNTDRMNTYPVGTIISYTKH